MPHYLIQVGYNTSGLAGLVKEPQDRIEKGHASDRGARRAGRVRVLRLRRERHRLDLRDARQLFRCGLRARGRRRRDRFVVQDHGPAHAGGGGPGDDQGKRVELQARGWLKARPPIRLAARAPRVAAQARQTCSADQSRAHGRLPLRGKTEERARQRDRSFSRKGALSVAAGSRLPSAVNRRARQGHGVGSLKS
jgi:hypothetical protein